MELSPNAVRSTSSSEGPQSHVIFEDSRGHAVQFYAEDESLVRATSSYIGSALVGGHTAVVVATRTHREQLARVLKQRGLDTMAVVEQGRYLVLDAAECLSQFMEGSSLSEARFNEVVGGLVARAAEVASNNQARVVAFGEMVSLLWADGKTEAAIRLEQMWNELSKKYSFSLLCAYPMDLFDEGAQGEKFLQVCEEHSGVVPDESYTALPTREDRLRKVAQLQQQARALQSETALRQQLQVQIAERMTAELRLSQSQQSLRHLSAHLLRTQDEERRHLGRDLHDGVGQYLAALKMMLESCAAGVRGTATERSLREIETLAAQCINEVRTMSYLLCPPMLEEMGLRTAIPWFLDGFAKRSGIKTTLEMSMDIGRLAPDIELAIFRVFQETLTNILRHSGSPTANIRIQSQEGMVLLEIKDQGKGISDDVLRSVRDEIGTLGVGLRGMNERVRQLGGRFDISSSSEGTTVRAAIPQRKDT